MEAATGWSRGTAAGVTAGTVLAIDLLAWQASPGLGAAISCALGLALATIRRPQALRDLEGRVLLVAGSVAAVSLAIEPGPLGVVLALGCAAALTARATWPGPEPWVSLLAAASYPFRAIGRAAADAVLGLARRDAAAKGWLSVLRGWLIPATIALVFAALFALGDVAFARGADAVVRWLRTAAVPSPARVVWWLLLAAGAWGLLQLAAPAAWLRAPWGFRAGAEGRDLVSPGLACRTLALVHLVFALENVAGVRHAWLRIPLEGTLSEGARRGAGALVAAVALSALLTLLAFRPGSPVEASVPARALAGAWLLQVAFVVVTAQIRMNDYVQAYGLTRWRFAGMATCLLAGVGVTLLAARLLLRRDNGWLARGAAAATLALLGWVTLTDVDGRIASFNVRHCKEAGGPGTELDVPYLLSLGPEALPALRAARRLLPPNETSGIRLDAGVHALVQRVRADQDPRGASVRRSLLQLSAASL